MDNVGVIGEMLVAHEFCRHSYHSERVGRVIGGYAYAGVDDFGSGFRWVEDQFESRAFSFLYFIG